MNKAIIEQLSVSAGQDCDLYLTCDARPGGVQCAWEVEVDNGMLLSELLARGVLHFREVHGE